MPDTLNHDSRLGGVDHTVLDAILQPIESATGLPNQAYVSEAYAAFERDSLLAKTWVCLGVRAQVPLPGDVKPISFLGLPLLMARDRKGEVRVFHNVCSHRGMVLVSEPCNAKAVIRCPYHSWTYGLDGALRATPDIGGAGKHNCPGFEAGKHGLKPVRIARWGDVVFANLSGDAPEFETVMQPLKERWRDFDISLLRHGGADSHFELQLKSNWKLVVENFCEAYHLPSIHPGLNSYSRLEDHYNIEKEGHFSGQGSLAWRRALGDGGRSFPAFPNLPAAWNGKAEYVALYPNVQLGVHADHLFVITLIPQSASRTLELVDVYYVGEEALGDDYAAMRRESLEAWAAVFREDLFVCQGMQKGRQSPAYGGGAFSPAMDGPTHCFHKWNAERLRALLGREPAVAAE